MEDTSDQWSFDLDLIKIGLAVICSVVVAWAAPVGLILTLVLFGGLCFGVFRKSMRYVRASTRIVQFVPLIGAIAGFVFMSLSTPELFESSRDAFIGLASILGVCVAAIALEYLWLSPLTRQFTKLSSGVRQFASAPPPGDAKRPKSLMPMRFPSSYSAADELKKWDELRKAGAISEDEFTKIRGRLLETDHPT